MTNNFPKYNIPMPNYNNFPGSNCSHKNTNYHNNSSVSSNSSYYQKNNTNFQKTSNHHHYKKDNKQEPLINILGINIYFDDLLILSLMYFLYKEGIKDDGLFFALLFLLIS